MNNYKIPSWLYKKANISGPDTNLIKLEFLTYLKKYAESNGTGLLQLKSQFVGIDVTDHENFYYQFPTVNKVLKEFGINNLLSVLAFVIVSEDKDFPIHVDCLDPSVMSFALNIPVLNCKNSKTVWYQTDVCETEWLADSLPSLTYHSKYASLCNSEHIAQIGECPAEIPHWVNIATPHAPVCDHSNLRINSSLRFNPKIYDFLYNGDFENKMIISD